MQVRGIDLYGCVLIEPTTHVDGRGYFLETFNRDRFAAAELPTEFVQDNHSKSRCGVLRGLHYQIDRPQGKLIWAVEGEIFDVAVDLRRSSPTFGHWTSVVLSAASHRQFYIPPGFAHGFYALTDAQIIYKCTDIYSPAGEQTILWNDDALGIHWPVQTPILSQKDSCGLQFANALYFD